MLQALIHQGKRAAFFLFCLLHLPHAIAGVDIQQGLASPLNVSRDVSVWHDPSGRWTIQQWPQAFAASHGTGDLDQSPELLKHLSQGTRNYGRLPGAVWMVLKVNNAGPAVRRYLGVGPSRLEAVQAWVSHGTAPAQWHSLGLTGLTIPPAQRPSPTAFIVWEADFPSGESTVVFRIQSRTVLDPEVFIRTRAQLEQQERSDTLAFGLYLGGMGVTTLLAFASGILMRRSIWMVFCVQLMCLVLHQTCFMAQAPLLLLPHSPQATLVLMALALTGAHCAGVWFFVKFIRRGYLPAAGRYVAYGLMAASIVGFALVLAAGFEVGIVVLEVTGVFLPLLLMGLAWRAWRRGDASAFLLLVSFLLLALSTLARGIILNGLAPSREWVDHWFVPLSGVVTSAILLLAMAQRIRLLEHLRKMESDTYQLTLESRIETATRELTVARDKAEAAVQFKQRFLARVSHDLRTPLNVLIGNANLCLGYLDRVVSLEPAAMRSRLTECLHAVKRSSSYVLQLAEELLSLARGNLTQLRLNLAPTNLHELLHDITITAQWLAADSANQFVVDELVECDEVHMDADRVKQVVINLLSNAFAATQGGVVTLVWVCRPLPADNLARMEVKVIDTGRGIAAHDLERIFEPFEQVGAGNSAQSSGLGLTIARQWVRIMGGDIAVQSQPGQGSTFGWSADVAMAPGATAPMPLLAQPGEGLATHAATHSTRARTLGRVVLVGDAVGSLLPLVSALERHGLGVEQVGTGAQALPLLVSADGVGPDGDTGVQILIVHAHAHADFSPAQLQRAKATVPGLCLWSLGPLPPEQAALCDGELLLPLNPSHLQQLLAGVLPPRLNWTELLQLAQSGDGLAVDAWVRRHAEPLGHGPLARRIRHLADTLQLAALARLLHPHTALDASPVGPPPGAA
ncbi:MAG: ATP-binding protein [Rhodoferax sp.]|nr:ATP-binding protein [Rhodoferax sp.]